MRYNFYLYKQIGRVRRWNPCLNSHIIANCYITKLENYIIATFKRESNLSIKLLQRRYYNLLAVVFCIIKSPLLLLYSMLYFRPSSGSSSRILDFVHSKKIRKSFVRGKIDTPFNLKANNQDLSTHTTKGQLIL